MSRARRRNSRSGSVNHFAAHASEMRNIFSQPIDWFERLGTVTRHEGRSRWKSSGRTIHIDRGSSVLAVAHLDSVREPSHFWMNHSYVSSPTIDNRLGAWLILCALPRMGITPDVLLTENEESCDSTAQYYMADKQYNWAFSFDRQGSDVACYQYFDKETKELLSGYNLEAARGSYSDVADLSLGSKGFNFGCAMYHYHTDSAYCDLRMLSKQLDKFQHFYREQQFNHIAYGGERYKRWSYEESYWQPSRTYSEWNSKTATTYPLVRHHSSTDAGDLAMERYYAAQARVVGRQTSADFNDMNEADNWWTVNTIAVQDDKWDETMEDWRKEERLVVCDYCSGVFEPADVIRHTRWESDLCKRCYYEIIVDGS